MVFLVSSKPWEERLADAAGAMAEALPNLFEKHLDAARPILPKQDVEHLHKLVIGFSASLLSGTVAALCKHVNSSKEFEDWVVDEMRARFERFRNPPPQEAA